MILVIAEFAIPLLAFVALDSMMRHEPSKKEFMKGLKLSVYIVGGLALFFLIFAGIGILKDCRCRRLTGGFLQLNCSLRMGSFNNGIDFTYLRFVSAHDFLL